MRPQYKSEFYCERHDKTVYAANRILDLVLKALPPVRSAVDLGCGVGTWLAVLRDRGLDRVVGFDGAWVDPRLLKIPRECFRAVDLCELDSLEGRYDLAISLEVAEHLPPELADRFVALLTAAADFVLFSAAVPFQGGIGHVNEQWPEYWVEKFAARGFAPLDVVRPHVWSDTRIPVWYRQNVFLFVNRARLHEIRLARSTQQPAPWPYSVVHPELYTSKMERLESVSGSLRFFLRAVRNRLRRLLGGGRAR